LSPTQSEGDKDWKGIKSMGVTVASGKDLKIIKQVLGYDPRTGQTHPETYAVPQQNTMEPSGNSAEVKGTEAKEEGQKGKE